MQSRAETIPRQLDQHTLFFDAKNDPNNAEGRELVDRFAYLDQDKIVTCDPDALSAVHGLSEKHPNSTTKLFVSLLGQSVSHTF